MKFNLITINYPEGEYNAKTGQLVFESAEELKRFLTTMHPTYTSAIVIILPVKAKTQSRRIGDDVRN